MLQIETKHFKRITKATARRMYNAGENIALNPSNLHPESLWNMAYITNIESEERTPFETLINHFSFYNCIDNETGKNVFFYQVKEGVANDE